MHTAVTMLALIDAVRLLRLVGSAAKTTGISVLRGRRFQHEVDVGPVEAQLGRMAAVDLDVTVGDDLLDEGVNLVDYDRLDRFDLVHDRLDTLIEEDHLVVQLVEDLLGVARALLVERLLAFLAKRILHLNEEVVVLDLRLCNQLLRRMRLLHKGHICLQIALLFYVFLLHLALVTL